MAVHAPDAVRVLGNQASFDELRILEFSNMSIGMAFPFLLTIGCVLHIKINLLFNIIYSDIFLHHDKNLMPRNPIAWSAWNFLGSTDDKVCLTYWLNVLQNLGETNLSFLVTLNPSYTPEHTLLKWSTGYPVPSVAASKASLELDHIQGKRRVWFCGAYLDYGFHEDGLKAGMVAAHRMLGKSYAVLKPKHMFIGGRRHNFHL